MYDLAIYLGLCCVCEKVSRWLEEWDTDSGFFGCFHALVGNRNSSYAFWSWGNAWVYACFYSLSLSLFIYNNGFLFLHLVCKCINLDCVTWAKYNMYFVICQAAHTHFPCVSWFDPRTCHGSAMLDYQWSYRASIYTLHFAWSLW